MDWKQAYQQRLVSAAEAAKVVKSGDWVEYAFGVASGCAFDEALAARKDELADVKIRCDIGAYPHFTLENDPELKTFTWNSWHVSAHDKKWLGKGLYYIPMKFHENPTLIRNNCDPDDVFVAMVSPMDKHGYFSWGAGGAAAMAAHETAKVTVLEVNPKMPRVLGGGQECVHVSDVDYIIEAETALPILTPSQANEVESKIASHIAPRLRDGSCLQLGIGGVPNAVGTVISGSDLKDLGVHTEMYVDAYIEMYKAGKITGKYKNLDKYKQVFAFAMGSEELYDFIDDNPGCVAYNVDYTNDPKIIAQIDNFVSINACIEVDLYGQVAAETVGTRHISGTGGQLDFVEGAFKSQGGQSFICLASSKALKDGTVTSTINPILTPGAIVTTPRTATHMIVTEYGIADMKGKSTWERAEALIGIAHPDFQDELIAKAEAQAIWRKSNKR
ncbi:MAG: butyryl-CoA:acetate CoA-transferase [Clostridiales Family XIII bacterium]|jgi:butyryl-CoA:acetate CoA-transferase|nr:butyryl-CoA:acetate CoA-transferase [Clostridiales Family XIII bacterium]